MVVKDVAKKLILEIIGWSLVLLGLAALVLPGPGLLLLLAGLVVLSQQYDWAERRVEPLKAKALKGAAEGVETWPRIILSALVALGLMACGVFWIWSPPAPGWWPIAEHWWLPGGIWTGATQVASGMIGLGLLVYSVRKFRD